MTKKELKEKYSTWNQAITQQYFNRKEEILKELQEMSYSVCGERYCGVQDNLKEALKSGRADRALGLYEEYYQIQGAWDSLLEFGASTENFKI